MDNSLKKALAKVELVVNGQERLTSKQALTLLIEADLLILADYAYHFRLRLSPKFTVTYCIDRNISTTNVCLSGCRFCAFFRPLGHIEAYVLTRKELAQKICQTIVLSGFQILIQGGLHPKIGVFATCELFRFIKNNFDINIHGLSPTELLHMARYDGISVSEGLDCLIDAGLDSIPGGGAEILVDRVRNIVAPKKCTANEWLTIMSLAHQRGLMTTATMMFGSVESQEECIEHLNVLRELQDKSLMQGRGHFTAFIPWSFQPVNTEMSYFASITSVEYLRLLAISRLFLDNFPHVQASWVTQGAKIAQLALVFGADDIGSTMIEENVVSAAGVNYCLSCDDLIRLVWDMNFSIRQRDTFYCLI